MKIILLLSIIANSFISWNSYAEPVTGKGELGFSNFSGNSNSQNLKLSLNLDHVIGQWEHGLDIIAIKNTNEGELEAESYTGDFKSDYFYKQQSYIFGAVRYEEDHFSSFNYQSSLSLGVGTRVIESDRVNLDLSLGLGIKKFKEQNNNNSKNEPFVRFGTEYLFQITDNTQFTEELLIELSEDNTKANSISSLYVYISDEIALKLSLSIKHNSTTSSDIEKTDTQSTASVSYTF